MADSPWGIYGAGIFGDTPVTNSPPPVPPPSTGPAENWSAADPGISIVGSNGDLIILKLSDEDYAPLTGATGFGIAPRALTLLEGAGDGGTVRYTRATARDIDLPVAVFGASRGEVGDRQRRLASALRYRSGKPAPRLRFTIETGETWEIEAYYVSGAETTIGEDGTAVYCMWLLTLRCPDPYWTATSETTFLASGTGTGRGLLPRFAQLQLSSSQVLGSVTVDNPGDVPADITWRIAGPGGPFTATDDSGDSFTFETALSPGEVITIDTATGAVTDAYGRNRYADLGPAPKLFKLPDGTSTISVSLDGATNQSSVIGRYRARREVMY